jgi:hypothetical protein
MRRLQFLVLFLSFAVTLFAEEPKLRAESPLQAGLSKFGAETVDQIHAAGLVKLNGTTVRNLVQVSGSLLAQSARLSSLEVAGEANFTNSTISGPSTIIGGLRAQGTTFQSHLHLATQRATFTNSTLASITVRKDDACKGKQILELKQNSTVNGPIHFESGKGEVHLYPGSHAYGPLTGGKLIKKN